MSKLVDISGKRFSRLLVLSRAGNNPGNNNALWRCRCDCGRECVVDAQNLRTGHTRSCGCLLRDICKARGNGLSKRPEYGIWSGMIQRCTNDRTIAFQYYGARGIKVCKRWTDSFVDFLSDVGPRPSRLHQIERKNNQGDYEPGNCRWATVDEQANNRNSNLFLEIGGVVKTAVQWSRQYGVDPRLIYARLGRGWDIQRALLVEPDKRRGRRKRNL